MGDVISLISTKEYIMSRSDVKTKIKPIADLKEPSLFKIVYCNDDVTDMSFVIQSLISYFNHDEDTAVSLTENIHENGSAVVAILPFEIAEQKEEEVIKSARSSGYPLKILLEKTED